MRKFLAITAVALTLALGLTMGGARFSAFSAQVGGHAPMLASLSGPDGTTCGGGVSTPC